MKRIFALAISVVVLLSGCGKELPITLDAAEIVRIDRVTLSAETLETENAADVSDASLVAGMDDEAISHFVDTYNASTRYTGDVGTTHPYFAKITFADGSTMTIWAGTQGFLTAAQGDTQFNLKNDELEALIVGMDGTEYHRIWCN